MNKGFLCGMQGVFTASSYGHYKLLSGDLLSAIR